MPYRFTPYNVSDAETEEERAERLKKVLRWGKINNEKPDKNKLTEKELADFIADIDIPSQNAKLFNMATERKLDEEEQEEQYETVIDPKTSVFNVNALKYEGYCEHCGFIGDRYWQARDLTYHCKICDGVVINKIKPEEEKEE
jgi:hypothetical protein